MLSMLEQALRSAANNNPQMMYGNNLAVINNMLSTIAMVNNLKSALQADNSNDAYTMNLRSKIFELENIIAMFGQQKLMSFGINIGSMQPQMSPLTANQPMYNQPMYYSNMMAPQQQMPVQMPQMPQMQQSQMQQQQIPPQMPQMQQSAPVNAPPAQPVLPQASQPSTAPELMSAPAPVTDYTSAPIEMTKTSAPQASSSGASMGFPGMGGGGGDAKALGRDYLLKLLSEK